MSKEQALPAEIRGVLIPVSGARLLLPNASVAEVITLSTPEAVANAPDWLLGRVGWRGWRVPLVAFTALAGLPDSERGLNSRVTVLKVFGGNPHMPFVALVTQGFPRLTTISADKLMPLEGDDALPPGVQRRLLVDGEEAIIPDLAFIENEVSQFLESAAADA